MISPQPVSSSNKPPLRVGLLMNGFNTSYTYSKVIESFQSSAHVELVVVVLNLSRAGQRKITLKKLVQRFNYLLFYFYQWADKKLFRPANNVMKPVDVSHRLRDIPVLKIQPETKGFIQRFHGEDIQSLKSYQPDILIRMGFRILKGEILHVARYGIWSYHHADNKVNRGGPPCFWEMFEKNPVTGTVVQVLGDDLDNGKVLCKSFGATHKYSLSLGRNLIYAKSIRFIPSLTEKLYKEGDGFLNEKDSSPIFYSKPLYTIPTNLQMSAFLFRLIPLSFFKFFRQLLFRNQWFLLYYINSGREMQTSMRKMKPLRPPRNRMWADPDVVYRNGTYYIFFEEKFFSEEKAHISLITLDESQNFSNAVRVLDRPYHLSHPFIFSYNGSDYMIPESRTSRNIELYKAHRFPDQWEFVTNILENVDAVDCTLHEYEGTWWMFVNQAVHPAASCNDELYLYSASSPLGPWTPHPQNPVKSDVRNSRPAGRIFLWNGKRYRPAQDCSQTYGYGVRINEIVNLSETEFIEKEVDFIEPLWEQAVRGVHTYTFCEGLTMADGMQRRFRL